GAGVAGLADLVAGEDERAVRDREPRQVAVPIDAAVVAVHLDVVAAADQFAVLVLLLPVDGIAGRYRRDPGAATDGEIGRRIFVVRRRIAGSSRRALGERQGRVRAETGAERARPDGDRQCLGADAVAGRDIAQTVGQLPALAPGPAVDGRQFELDG